VLDDTSLDTTTRTGKLVFGILASIAEFETALGVWSHIVVESD